MAINAADIKLKGSERLTDNDDGGGRMTGYEIIDGDINNLFPDVSRLDRVYGRVNLRKAFVHVDTANVDSYMGAHSIISGNPADPNIHALMFSTGSHTDERLDAQDRIESYVIRGPIGPWYLYDRQLTGQRSIRLFSRVNAALPEVGDVLALVQNEGAGDEFEQYVRVTSVADEILEFTGAINTNCSFYERKVITCEISVPLRYTFDGPGMTCYDSLTPAAIVRETQVADASKYYGAQSLNVNVTNGDLTLNAASIYGQLVPSTQGEAPVLDVQAGGVGSQTITSGGEDFDITGPVHTGGIDVEINNRAYSYVFSCQPIPAPGTLVAEYRAMGRWYRLQDDGSGSLEGEGAGSVDFGTGSVSVTLGALPDVGSSVLFSWATPVHFIDRAGTADYDPVYIEHTLPYAIKPGTLSMQFVSGGNTKTVTDSNGALVGDASGDVLYSTGRIRISFTGSKPDSNSQLVIDYDEAALVTETFNDAPNGSGIVNVTLGTTPIKAGSVDASWLVEREQRSATVHYETVSYSLGSLHQQSIRVGTRASTETKHLETKHAEDDGAGAILGGTIDYTTGALAVKVIDSYDETIYQAQGNWSTKAQTETYNGTLTVKYMDAAVVGTTHQETIAIPPMVVTILPLLTDDIIPGTLRFTYGPKQYSDRAGQGVLYWENGTIAGSVDYAKKQITITEIENNGGIFTIDSLISTYGQWYDWEYRFRTPGSPLQPGGMIVNATSTGGDLVTATSDFSGNISATGEAEGTVDQETGVTNIKYGALVADASLTPEEKAESWYDVNDIDGNGDIWKPLMVFPNTVRFSAVIYTILPLDADILGLDPVRLPSDGRVPIFRAADVIVLHQDETFTCPNNLVADQVVTIPIDHLASCILVDQAGTTVDPLLYTNDLEAGTITMANPLDLSAYTEPLIAQYRFEDMRLLSDVQINGTITCTSAIYHDYDKTKAILSSGLIFGDMQSRYHHLFTQYTWTNEWSDSRIGNDTTAKYNDTQYPIAVANEGTIKERWLIKFTSTTTFSVIGETIGQIASGSISGDLSPTNPESGTPYFTITAAGWGAGWSTGNCLRFNTDAAAEPMWIARTTISGDATENTDQFKVQNRGDAD